MQFELYPRINDDYNPKADNMKTINDNSNKKPIRYIICYQVISPIVAAVVTFFAIVYYRNNHSKHDEIIKSAFASTSEKRWKIRRNIFIIVSLSFTFTLYVTILDAMALAYNIKLNPAFKEWYRVQEFVSDLLRMIPIVYFCMDFTAFIFFLFLFIVRCCLDRCGHKCSCYNSCAGKKYCQKYFTSPLDLLFFIVIPVSVLTGHADQIIISFIHNNYHATAVCILYGVAIVLSMAFLKIIAKAALYIYDKLPNRSQPSSEEQPSGEEQPLLSQPKPILHIEVCWFVSIFTISLIIIFGIFTAFVFVFKLLPINIAIDEAPNHLINIQSIVAVFVAYLAYWFVLKEPTSPLEFLIKEKDKELMEKKIEDWNDNDKDWAGKNVEEKEVEIAKEIMNKYIKPRRRSKPQPLVSLV